MKDRVKRIWEEHKSRKKKPQDVIEDDTAQALEKMIRILSKSQDPELVKEKEKLNLVRKKVWKALSKQHKKEQEIQTIDEEIRKAKEPKTVFKLEEQLQKLKKTGPLEPLEMVDALLFFPKHPRYNISSIKEVSKRIDKLEKNSKFNTDELIYVASELTTTALITPIKYKIDLRKKFLEETTPNLSIVTKLPDKPGDQENISGVVKNLQESFKGVFTHDQELYKNLIDLLAESLQLLLRIRGELKAWADVDEFVKQYKITDGQLARMVKNAKAPDGGGIFKFLGGKDLKNLVKLLDKLEFLTQDHRLFYKSIINPHSTDNLILKLEKYQADLEQQIIATNTYHLYYACLSSILGFHFKNFSSSNINIILGYLGINNIIIRATKYYKEQLEHTSLAIKWLTGIQKLHNKHINKTLHRTKLMHTGLGIEWLDEIEIPDDKPRRKLKKEEYTTTLQSNIKEHKKKETDKCLEEKLLLLKQTQEILGFVQPFVDKNNVQYFQKTLQFLDLIELDSHSSNFLKIIDLRQKSNVEFIQRTIDPIIYLIRFFSFENMLRLNTNDELVQKEIRKIEKYLTGQTGPMLKTLVESAISNESQLLDSFSYLIKHKNSKKLNAFSLLDLLIRLAEYGKINIKHLLSVEGLNKLVDFTFTNQVVVQDGNKFFLLFYLIDSGYANIEMVNKLLKTKININESYNGRTLLDSIAYQLTKVGREIDFPLLVPKKYNIDPQKQDQLIDVALHLIHKGADINSDGGNTRGFLTTLFSIIPNEQSPYLYKKLLSDQEIISQLDLIEVDAYQRNIAHLFCRDLLEIFYSFPDKQVARKQVDDILTKIISSKNSEHLNNQDKEGNTPWHYLASSITADYLTIKTDFSLEKIKITFNLNKQNRYGDTPLHAAFTMLGDPAAFYEFVLTDIYSPAEWLKCPRLGLKIKNNQHQTVLAMIIHTNSKLAASAINTYMAVVNYKIDLDDGCTFETIRSKVDTFLKGIPQIPADEIGRTKYLGEKYDSTRCDSHSSCSSVSSSPSSSMPHSFPPSFSYYLLIQGDSGITDRGRTDTEYDCYSKSSLMGDNSDFTLHS